MASGSSVHMEVDDNDLKKRDIQINILLCIVEIIVAELGEVEGGKMYREMSINSINLDLSDELAGFLMTVYTCLRKEINDPSGHTRFLAYTAKIRGIDISVKSIVERVKAAKITIDFLMATPLAELLTVFRSFFDEVRTGVTRFRVRESVARKGVKRGRDGKLLVTNKQAENTQNIAQYGLTNQHIALLQGVTLAAERRTGIVKSLGPMTQALLLVMEDKYFDKVRAALMHSLQMLPMAEEIITALKDAAHPGNVSGVLKELGDILLLTTARSTQKMFVPLVLFISMWKHKGSVQWSFSGAPAIKYYTDFCIRNNGNFKIRSGADPLKTSEVVFHAMLGTYLGNLNILEQITVKAKWHNRRELGSVFLKRSEQSQVSFHPIVFKYVSKMAQALLTKSLGNVDPMSVSRPAFTGFRKRHFTQEFLTYISTGKSKRTQFY